MHICQVKCKNALRLGAAFIVALYVYLWIQITGDDYTKLKEVTARDHPTDNNSNDQHNNIRLVTYNMWCNYLASCKSNYKERFNGFAAGVKNFDIVMVQEVFVLRSGPLEFSNCASHMVEAMERHGFKYRTSFTDTVPYVIGQSNGIAIFSKIPFHNTKSVIYEDAAIGERINNKGFVYAELILQGKPLFIFNTHTDAHKESIRTAQIKQLTKTIKSLSKSAYLIVSGDFNINPNNPPADGNVKEYLNLLLMMMKVGLVSVFTKRNATHLNGGSYDYVFIGSNIKVKDRKVINLLTSKSEMVSDHYGLYTEVQLI